MALDSFQLLARQSEATEGDLQIKVLQTLFDLLVLHGINFGEERGFGVRSRASLCKHKAD
jgi:condensin complex subunit 3